METCKKSDLKPFQSVLLKLACAFLAFIATTLLGGDLQITEIMYHPASTNLLENWFEIQNTGSGDLDLSGWEVAHGIGFVFPAGTHLARGAWMVVAADRSTFASKHPQVTNFVAGWTGTLSRSSELISIHDRSGKEVVSVAYSNEGDWAVRRLGSVDRYNRRGWEWFAEHNGGGKSLEMINPLQPIEEGQNWGSSLLLDGTPGVRNSIWSTNTAPIIGAVSHFPIVPRSSDTVIINTRLLDNSLAGASATLHWRLDGAANFNLAPMFDDGTHGDRAGGDGVFAALIPPQENQAVVEFFIVAKDKENHERTFPAVIPSGTGRTANLAYQVDNSVYSGNQPIIRLIMTQAENDFLISQIWAGAPFSDAEVNGTFINTDGVLEDGSNTQVRYTSSIRNRGHGTRTAVPHNFHISFPADHPWKGRAGLNLNSHYTPSQQLGSAIFRRLEVPMADSRPVQLRVNGVNPAKPGAEQFGSYAANEVVDDNLVKRQFPSDPNGNLYRGIRDLIREIRSDADLTWHGPSYTSYTNAYSKENNTTLNDWSDFIHLLDVLNNSPEGDFVPALRSVANIDQWMRYFAINTLLDNHENSLGNGVGDDFGLYRGLKDTRFVLIPYDMDDLMGRGVRATNHFDGIWRMTNVPAVDRIIKRNEFAPIYFKNLKELAETAFSPATMNPFLDQLLASYVDPVSLANMKAFNASQQAYVLSLIPQNLTIESNLPILDGYHQTTTAQVKLGGSADVTQTFSVLVNNRPANYVAWQGRWNITVELNPGLNRLTAQAFGMNGSELGSTHLYIWYDDGSVTTSPATISSTTKWTRADGPYLLNNSVTIVSGATLTIEPGTSVHFGPGTSLAVANGGQLIAEGTAENPILFTHSPEGAGTWNGIVINGDAGSPETRIWHAHFEHNNTTAIHSTGGTVHLDHLTFGNSDKQYVSLDQSSFLVSNCHFPDCTSEFEGVHGTGGIKAGGRGIFLRNYFGSTRGYNDVIDFTGGNRTAPILQVVNNVFAGSSDDELDLDGTDAWVEGNIFLHCHKNGSPDSSSAVSGGSNGGATSEVTIIGNLFYDCDQAATAKQGNFYTFLHNTVVHQTRTGGLDTDGAVFNLADDGTTEGSGYYVEGNIIHDAEKLIRNFTSANLIFTNNILPVVWNGAGGGNFTNIPFFQHLPTLDETRFSNWEEAQVMKRWLDLAPGSPGTHGGENQINLGGAIPLGVSLGGVPSGTNNQRNLSITVGMLRKQPGIPIAGFPEGSGYTHYKWSLDGGPFSPSIRMITPITLSNLSNGPHSISVSGRRDSGFFQDDPAFGPDSGPTVSATWITDSSLPNKISIPVRLNEILSRNQKTFNNSGTTPDLIELYNSGNSSVDLGGMGLTDNSTNHYKYTFPTGTVLPSRAFLVLLADSATGGTNLHTGFSLKQEGDDLSLYDRASNGGDLIDSVTFGIQLPDYSVGRRADDSWGLCIPTFGKQNIAQPLGEADKLRINEWLADAQFVADNDFIEIFNPEKLPVDLGGLFLSDAGGSPGRHRVRDLSFIGEGGYTTFVSDGDPSQGADHLNFKLSPETGLILLSDRDLQLIDSVVYGSQRTDISEGRSPSGATTLVAFNAPTPGGANPGLIQGECVASVETIPLIPFNGLWAYQQTANLDGVAWTSVGFDDSAWLRGPGLLGVEDCNCLPAPGLQTVLNLGRNTYYFRHSFNITTNMAGFGLSISMVIDDGAVIFLNGKPLWTNSVTSPIHYTSPASRNVGNAITEFTLTSGSGLVQGTNILAAEVHQVNATSGDIVFGLKLDASRVYTNCAPVETIPILLSEVMVSNRSLTNHNGTTSDFLEVYNNGTNRIDLEGLGLTDDPAFSQKWLFTENAFIEPGAFKVIFCNSSQPVSSTNTGFNLSAKGGTVFLFAKQSHGGGLLDQLRYGLQIPDFSVSRLPVSSGNWNLSLPTPGEVNQAAGLGTVSDLRVNEWMADPASGEDWFEIFNSGNQPISLGGLIFTDDLAKMNHSPIAPLSFIGTGAEAFRKFIADGSADQGDDHVDFSLKKSGEAVGMFSPSGLLLDGVNFGNQVSGVSEGRFPDGSETILAFGSNPSPEYSNYLPITNVVISEILAHTDPPLEDAMELQNIGVSELSIGGWYLSNSRSDYKKHRIQDGTKIPGRGFKVFYENFFGSEGGGLNSAHGDSIFISEADASGKLTGHRLEISFDATSNGVSLGRYQTSIGYDFVPLAARTFGKDNPATVEEFRGGLGASNSPAAVGPVVISEIMYRAGTSLNESPNLEYLELRNITGVVQPLFDPAAPTNRWKLRGGVEFDFPENSKLQPQEQLLVVGFDPGNQTALQEFRNKYQLGASVKIFGPWIGQLDNNGETIQVLAPDHVQETPHPDAGFVPYYQIEKIHYLATSPWPQIPAGSEYSLQRISPLGYGNEPTNWVARSASPGSVGNVPGDSDRDGMDDAWERSFFTTLDRDGFGDFDLDGQTDLEEFQSGTDPKNPSSHLKIGISDIGEEKISLQFQAVSGKVYRIEYLNDLAPGMWQVLTNVSLTSGLVTVPDKIELSQPRKFYRLLVVP